MDFIGFFLVLVLAAAVTLVSCGLDVLYARVLPFRFLYYAIRMPGIALHELAHVVGCLVTGATIKKVVLFSKEGGSVTYAEPKTPLLGTVIISTAPLILLPLTLALLTAIFPLVFGSSLSFDLPSQGSSFTPYSLMTTITNLFAANLFVHFNGWFLLYIYLCITIILSLAPSRQDFANAAIGIALVAVACLLIIASGYEPVVAMLDRILSLLEYAFMIGLVFEMIVAIVALPLVLFYVVLKRI